MSTSVAISAVALSQSMAAQATANRAEHAACTSLLSTYDAKAATVAQAKQYAHCVEVAYPDQFDVEPMGLRIVVAVLLLATMGGALWGWKEEDDLGFALIGAVVVPLVLLAAIFFGWLLWAALMFVLTGSQP